MIHDEKSDIISIIIKGGVGILHFFRRFSNGLFAPSQIGQYRHDKWYTTLIFFLILLGISLIPVAIESSTIDQIDWGTQRDVKRAFQNVGPIPFHIEDGSLRHNTGQNSYVFQHRLEDNVMVVFNVDGSFQTDPLDASIVLFFTERGVLIYRNLMTTVLLEYTDHLAEFEGMDFADAYSPNNLDFWDAVFHVMSSKASQIKGAIVGMLLFVQSLTNVFYFLLYTLIISAFQSPALAGKVKFLKIWQLSIYILAPYVFGSVLAVLLNAALLSFVGLIMTVLYGSRMARSLWNSTR